MANGLYASTNDLITTFKLDNVNAWFSSNSSVSPLVYDDGVIQEGFNETDAFIISEFLDFGNYTSPLQPQGSDIYRVRRWSCVLCAEWGYFSPYGMRDQHGADGDTSANHLTGLADSIRSEIMRFRARDRLNALRRWPTNSGPAVGSPWTM